MTLKHPLLVEGNFQYHSKILISSPENFTYVVIPLEKYTFDFLRDDVDYCTGNALCSGLVSMYKDIYEPVRSKCKDVDHAALQAKYGMCESKFTSIVLQFLSNFLENVSNKLQYISMKFRLFLCIFLITTS